MIERRADIDEILVAEGIDNGNAHALTAQHEHKCCQAAVRQWTGVVVFFQFRSTCINKSTMIAREASLAREPLPVSNAPSLRHAVFGAFRQI